MTKRRIPIEEVAQIVRDWPTSTGYAPHIAHTYGIPLGSAYRWIAEARRRGALPAGGEHPCPTCKGTGVRRWGKQTEGDRA